MPTSVASYSSFKEYQVGLEVETQIDKSIGL